MSPIVTAGPGGELVLHHAGADRPLTRPTPYSIPPGTAIGATLALPPLLIVELTAGGAYRPALVFDAAHNLLSENLEHPGPDAAAAIGQAAAPVVAQVFAALAGGDLAGLPQSHADLARLQEGTRLALARHALDHAMPGFRNFDALPAPETLPDIPVTLAGQDTSLTFAAILALLGQRAPSLFAGLFAGQPCGITHPADGTTLTLRYAVPMSDMHHAYCFNGPAGDHPVTIICGVHETAVMAILIPGPSGTEGIVIRNHTRADIGSEVQYAAYYIGLDVVVCFLAHLLARFERLRPIGPGTTPCLVVREAHVGHHLWNELSGIQTLLDAGPAIPFRILSKLGPHGEPYGPLDRIFPETAGRIDRIEIHNGDLCDHAAANDLLLLRHATARVPRGVAARLTALAQADATPADHAALAEARAAGRPVLLIGLRLDNRTVRDPLAFLAATAAHLHARLGPLTLVLDGMNHPSGAPDAPPGPAATLERQLVDQLAPLLPPAVHLVDTIHRGLEASLFWANGADAFIAFWGAGLAKYRWIANKPGLVLSGAWNIRHRSDFGIYDSPVTMEDPTPLQVIPPELVTDIDAGDNQPTLASFDIDLPRWLETLDAYLAETLPAYVAVT